MQISQAVMGRDTSALPCKFFNGPSFEFPFYRTMRWWIRRIINRISPSFCQTFSSTEAIDPRIEANRKKLQNEKTKKNNEKEKDQNGRKRNLFRRCKRAKRRRSAVLLFKQSFVWTGTGDASTSVSKAIDVKTCTRQLYFRLGNHFAIYSRHIRTTTVLVCKSLSPIYRHSWRTVVL